MPRPPSIEHEYRRRTYHLKRLGLLDGGEAEAAYTRYLESELWQAARMRYEASDRPPYCFVCGARTTQLHHSTYARLGFERPEDLVRLCDRHHKSTTSLIDHFRYPFAYAHRIEREAYWDRRMRHLRPLIEQRIQDAVRTGRLPEVDPVMDEVIHLPSEYLDPIELHFCPPTAPCRPWLKIYVTFPDGPDREAFVLNTTARTRSGTAP